MIVKQTIEWARLLQLNNYTEERNKNKAMIKWKWFRIIRYILHLP